MLVKRRGEGPPGPEAWPLWVCSEPVSELKEPSERPYYLSFFQMHYICLWPLTLLFPSDSGQQLLG